MSGISFSPKAWNFSADSQTSRTHRPPGTAPTTWDRQPPPGQSASERISCPLFSPRQTSSYCSVVPPGKLKITPIAMIPLLVQRSGGRLCRLPDPDTSRDRFPDHSADRISCATRAQLELWVRDSEHKSHVFKPQA